MATKLPSKSYARIDVNLSLPDLIEVQIESFERLKREGLADLFFELSPIESYNKGMKLYFPSNSKESKAQCGGPVGHLGNDGILSGACLSNDDFNAHGLAPHENRPLHGSNPHSLGLIVPRIEHRRKASQRVF